MDNIEHFSDKACENIIYIYMYIFLLKLYYSLKVQEF